MRVMAALCQVQGGGCRTVSGSSWLLHTSSPEGTGPAAWGR